jgi:hypothetical protein
MPRVTAFNLRQDDPLPAIEDAIRRALTSIPSIDIDGGEVDLVPMLAPEGFHAAVARIDVDLWERRELTKEILQELAITVADGFLSVVGKDRRVKAVIRPYDVTKSGWVSSHS